MLLIYQSYVTHSLSNFFLSPANTTHRQYEALRAHYVEGQPAAEAARRFGYTLSAYYSLMHRARQIGSTPEELSRYFFHVKTVGRKPDDIGSGWQLGVSPSRRLFGYDRSLLLLMTNRGHFMTRRSEAMPR